MKIFDLNYLAQDSVLETDICIIGGGPAGLTIAQEFLNTGTRILLLESGGMSEEPQTQALYEIESTGDARVMDQNVLRQRILGGSSHIWTGRCAPFDASDFKPRPWIPFSGWPLTRTDFEPFLERAGKYLGIGPNYYDESLWQRFGVARPAPPIDGKILRPMFWQFSRGISAEGSMDFGRDMVDSPGTNVEILLHANVTHINLSPDGASFDSVEVNTLDQKKAAIKAKTAVFCCGGIENARLLLASHRVYENGVGNSHDQVGRYLMDHTNNTAGYFDPQKSSTLRSRFGHYWLDDAQGRHVYLHGFGLTPEAQEEYGLLNCHAYLEQIPSDEADPWVALKNLKGSLRSQIVSSSDLKAVLHNIDHIGYGAYRRRFQHRAQLLPLKRIELHLMLEQMPDPESRVTLSKDKQDALGMPISVIHWHVSDAERLTAKKMVEWVSEELVRLGLPEPKDVPSFDEGSNWKSRFVEKAHPTGTTRMSVHPTDGVVDPNGQVHGIRGLFMAGSSVFPTSGAANPTLMIVANSIRLADHLKVVSSSNTVTTSASASFSLREKYEATTQTTDSTNALRVGIVGAGRRASQIYLPILRELSSLYKIVGFTSSSVTGMRRFESETALPSFRTAAELVEHGRPELLVVAVPDQQNERTLLDLLEFKVPILAETPIAWSIVGAKRIIAKAAANHTLLGVAEQFPFLPIEQFRHLVVDSGALGDIYSAYNDFKAYSYHGIAQLRQYIKDTPLRCHCTETNFGISETDGVETRWQTGTIVFKNAKLLVHNYATPYRGLPQSFRVYGTRGTMSDDAIFLNGLQSASIFHAVRKEQTPGHLDSITCDLPQHGRISWENPFEGYCFTDEQIAVATILNGMSHSVRDGVPPPYSAEEALRDIEIVQAFRYSSGRDGRPVSLPLRVVPETLKVKSRNYGKKLYTRTK